MITTMFSEVPLQPSVSDYVVETVVMVLEGTPVFSFRKEIYDENNKGISITVSNDFGFHLGVGWHGKP